MDSLLKNHRKTFSNCTFSTVRHTTGDLKSTLLNLANSVSQAEEADVYGSGPIIENFESEIAEMLGKEAAVFMPSGTMAQPIALRIWADAQKSNFVSFHGTSHLALHEQNSYQILFGLNGVTLGSINKVPELRDIKAAAASPLAAVLLELPMREIGGQLPPWDDLVAQSHWAKENNIKMHMDGARLWQCPAAYDKSLSEISDLFDSVYVSFYKDLGGIAGAVLAGDKKFIANARVWQKRCGGNLHALYPYVLAAREGLKKYLPNMPDKLTHAKWFASQLNQFPEFQTWPIEPHTNMFRLRVNCIPKEFIKKSTDWMKVNNVSLLTPPYQISEDHILCELSFGDAFAQKTNDVWKAYLNDFRIQVF